MSKRSGPNRGSNDTLREGSWYGAYGTPWTRPVHDFDANGSYQQADEDFIDDLINTSSYDVRADLDLDGDVDSTDKDKILSAQGLFLSHGYGHLSNNDSTRGLAGLEHDGAITELMHIRARAYDTMVGRWSARDPARYADGMNLYQYVGAQPLAMVDPTGRFSMPLEEKPSDRPPKEIREGRDTRTGSRGSGCLGPVPCFSSCQLDEAAMDNDQDSCDGTLEIVARICDDISGEPATFEWKCISCVGDDCGLNGSCKPVVIEIWISLYCKSRAWERACHYPPV